MLVFPFVRITAQINNHAKIRTKGNTNIKNSLIRICDTDKSRTDKVRRIKFTHKRLRSLMIFVHFLTLVNGHWTDWLQWSSCSVACGSGQKTRQRLCLNPAPSNGGRSCSGASSEHLSCLAATCPGDVFMYKRGLIRNVLRCHYHFVSWKIHQSFYLCNPL